MNLSQVKLLACFMMALVLIASFAMARDNTNQTVMVEYLQKAGLTWYGTFTNAETSGLGAQIAYGWRGSPPDEALLVLDKLIEQCSREPTLQMLADDALLQKANALFMLKRYDQARSTYQTVVTSYPDQTWDLEWFRSSRCLPSAINPQQGFTTRLSATCYAAKHANKTADLAVLGVAQCLLAQDKYEDAKNILLSIIPNQKKESNLSEDPIARAEVSGDYLNGFEESSIENLLSRRPDKNALLLLARTLTVLGSDEDARRRYNQFIERYPACAAIALEELALLDSGKKEEISKKLKGLLRNPDLQILSSLSKEEIEKLKREPDLRKRIEAARKLQEKRGSQ